MSAESPASYNKLPEGHEAVFKYQPRFLARGGDHLVYEAEGHPNTVIKASTFKIKDILADNAERGLPLDGLSDEMRAALEKEIKEKNQQIRMYREYFGKEHTLSEHRYLMRVPVSTEIIQEIFKEDWKDRTTPDGVDEINEAWSAVVIQEKAPAISDPQHLGLYFGGFIEQRQEQPSPSEYEQLNAAFLGKKTITPEDLVLFFRTQDNPSTHALADLVTRAKENEDLKAALKDFVGKSLAFANDTGHILALAGEDNVVLYPKGEEDWKYLLVDAIPVYNDPIFKTAKEAKKRLADWGEVSDQDRAYVLRAMNFARTINGLAAALDMEERLEF